MPTWVNFKELREKLDFADVLKMYGVEIHAKGDQHHGVCPLPGHECDKQSKSFSAHLAKGIFRCFGCNAQGNVIEFTALMENLDPSVGRDLRKAALVLKERFVPDAKVTRARNPKAGFRREPKAGEEPGGSLFDRPALVNSPLDFELKDLDDEHPFFQQRGLTAETIDQFGLGYCRKGYHAGRIAIPLHDNEANLIGYAGRLVDKAESADVPKYLLPAKRERNGVVHEFKKSLFVYNAHRLSRPVEELVVVEGFTSVWWLAQLGFPNVVAVMGADSSEVQAKIIVASVHPLGGVWLMPRGGQSGVRFAESLAGQLVSHRFVRWVRLGDGKKPTDYNRDGLQRLLSA